MSAHNRSVQFMAALAGGVSAFALAYGQPAMAQQAAQADQPAASGGNGLEEVVVTARRKEEKAQTVPISLQTFNQAALEDRQIAASYEFSRATPGVTMSAFSPTSQHTWVRGITGAVSYFDNAPEVSPGSFDQFFDIASAQVLKGPQGTLFGIATDGGAFVFEPKKPTNNFEGYVEATLGNYGRMTGTASVSIPIVEDKVLMRVAGSKSHTDGYIYDISRGVNLEDKNLDIGRVILTVNPTENISNEFLAGYYSFKSISYVDFFFWRINPSVLAPKAFGPQAIAAFNTQLLLGHYAIAGDDVNGEPFSRFNQWNLIDTATWDVNDNMTLKNILSYSQIFQAARSVGAGLGTLPISNAYNILPNGTTIPYQPSGPLVQYADEFQLLGKVLDDKLGYTIGAFNQMTRQSAPHPAFQCNTISFGAIGCSGGGNGSGATNALYAQGTYDLGALAEGLSITLGYRYTWDRIYAESNSYTQADVRIATSSGSQIGYYHKPMYTASLDYQLNPQTMFYVSDSKGYAKGGFNSITVPAGLQSYQPETLNSVEVGVKTDNEIYGIKTRVNLDAFYGFYSQIQATQFVIVPPAGPGLPTTTPQVTTNAATGHTEGIEGEFTIVPSDDFQFHLNVAYNIVGYDSYMSLNTNFNPPRPVDLSFLPFLLSPKFKFDTSFTYHLPILGWIAPGEELGDLSLTPNWSWVGVKNQGQGLQAPNPTGFDVATLEELPDTSQIDISVNWRNVMGRAGLDGTFFITNVNNNIWTESTNAGYVTIGYTGLRPATPRMMGVTLRYSFGN